MSRSRARQSALPVLPVHDDVLVFPHQAVPLYVGRPATMRAVEEAMQGERLVFLVAQSDQSVVDDDPRPDDLYRVGTVCRLLQLVPVPDNAIRVVVEGLHRARVKQYRRAEGYLTASTQPLELDPAVQSEEDALAVHALVRSIKEAFEEACDLGKSIAPEVASHLLALEEPDRLLDQVAAHLEAGVAERQRLLETTQLPEALMLLRVLLEREVEVLRIERDIENQVRREVGDSQKEYILRERMKAIQEELGAIGAEGGDDLAGIRRAIAENGLSEEAAEKANKELARLEHIPPSSPESVVIRTYLEALCELPWSVRTEDSLDINEAARILDEDHHGLADVKERILEFLAVRQLSPHAKGPILCFVGPPGVGKTSIGKSIARAMGRKFVRISLGGVRDEAEIRGHRRTYIGSMPGRIISAIRQTGVRNPVFMLDEVDKIGQDFRGDPAAALLEALDPEQNNQFSDHYLEVRFDLSEVMFLLTANLLDTIPPALLDRMEVIEFPGYIEDEKLAIAKDYLLAKQIAEHGLGEAVPKVGDAAILEIIRHYTREAGVRNLDRMIARVCRKIAREVAAGDRRSRRVTPQRVEELLGPPRYLGDSDREEDDRIGLATGLAYTSVGGSVLAVEVGVVEGSGELQLTGRLGEVMKESAQAALTYVRSRADHIGLELDVKKSDIHIHVPEGATPKDGPSAGVTMGVALASALGRRPVRREVAMSGEITLRGRVLPVGGVRDKVLAAYRNEMTEVILPAENRRDVQQVPARVRRSLTIHFVRHMDEVLRYALVGGRELFPVSETTPVGRRGAAGG
ncbi:MAG: endopeptidase La [Armatimonadetes bacterium]|nr:endopeptidase La [Armatimonadota bacterium]